MRHILLGAGGAISRCLTQELLAQNRRVLWVSRRGAVLDGVASLRADLLSPAEVLEAVEPGAQVYLLAGLRYDLAVWRDEWPRIMRNVVEACSAKRAGLVFFDNVYMYGKVQGAMTESSAIRPCSRKGELRAAIAESLMAAVRAGRLQALIARSADFYGPCADATSVLNGAVLGKFSKGQRALWLGDPAARHSFTFTPDCGKALALLAATESAYGQVWHLPTAPAMSGHQLMDLAARTAGVKASSFTVTRWMLRAGGLFDRNLRELVELYYQFDSDYIFDASKFQERFQGSGLPTPYEAGMRETLEVYRQISNPPSR